MKIRTWPFLLVGFGALLLVIGLSAVAVERRIDQVRADVKGLQQANEVSGQAFDDLRSNIFAFAILLRDFILEPTAEEASEQRRMIEALHQDTLDCYGRLRALGTQHTKELQELESAIEEHWQAIEPVLGWSFARRAADGPEYILRHVTPKRQVAFDLAARIEVLNRSESLAREQEILETQGSLRDYLIRAAIATLLLGGLVAAVSIVRTRSLETNAERHLEESERSASGLRRLSSKLSQAQEDERRRISRELHDQVGQTLTALRLEIGNLEALRHDDARFEEHIGEARKLAEETLRSVRDLSVGLRPTVLDELGLAPALRWQAREFTRRTGVGVDIQVDGSLDKLEDAARTCVYRVVQEALTNCARHAKATRIQVAVRREQGRIEMKVEDNGSGFDVAAGRSRGLGLLGAQERVRELGGTLQIESRRGQGTSVCCSIPMVPEATA